MHENNYECSMQFWELPGNVFRHHEVLCACTFWRLVIGQDPEARHAYPRGTVAATP